MSLIIKKQSDIFFRLMIKESKDNYRNITKELNNVLLPFGLEEYKGKYLINIELSSKKNIDMIELIKLLESKIPDMFESKDLEISSILKEAKDPDNFLLKGNIKKNKNTIITKFYVNDKASSIYQISKGCRANLTIEISGVWKHKNNLGLFINIKKIDTTINI